MENFRLADSPWAVLLFRRLPITKKIALNFDELIGAQSI